MQSKRLLFAALASLLLGIGQIMAQVKKGFEVESFKELTDDTSAQFAKEYEDEDGKKCAIIKIHTPLKDVDIQTGDGYEIVHIDREHFNTTGEIWVYVPEGVSKLRFKHQTTANENPYYEFPDTIQRTKSAKVYSMILRANGAKITFNILPDAVSHTKIDNVKIYVDDTEVTPNEESASFSIDLEKGEHSYRIEAPGYETLEGKEMLTKDDPKILTISLKRQFGYFAVTSEPDKATVFVDGEKVGETNYKSGRMKFGSYKVHVEMKNYKPWDGIIKITAEKDTNVVVPLQSSSEGRRTLVMLEAGYHPSQISFGAMVGMVETNGAYLRFRSDFGSASTDLECDDTGYLTAGGTGLPYYKEGATSKARMSITAGYLRRIAKPLYLYVGAGYGSRTLAWETIDGELVKNTDHSATGVAGEIGAIGRFGKFALSVGYQTVNFKYHEASLGIGFMF